jgi:hypothetical protein
MTTAFERTGGFCVVTDCARGGLEAEPAGMPERAAGS